MASIKSLARLRSEIDALDLELLTLLNRRAQLAIDVAHTKTAAGEGDCFYRPDREAEVLRSVLARNPGPLDGESVAMFFRELMSACLALEKPMNVAFLGPEGTFTQQAAHKHFGHSIKTSPLMSIDEIFSEVLNENCQFGVVPVENSTEGVITHTLDSFLNSPLRICGEVLLRIHQNLLSNAGEMEVIEQIFSHQQSFAQCRGWLDRHLPWANRIAVSSNTEAVRLAQETERGAAIAGKVAAELYKLPIIESDIEDDANNTTRFLIIGKHSPGATNFDKTTLLISAKNQPGALYKTLEPFAQLEISMTKIESRPSKLVTWDYVFFIDLEGHKDDPKIAQALHLLADNVKMLKVLGSYPQAVLQA